MIIDAAFEKIIRRFNGFALKFPDSRRAIALPRGDPGKRYLLYLHIPYCESLCPFCSFHRVAFRADSASRYFINLRREIRHVTNMGYAFDELYVGGGTPTVLPGELVATINELRKEHSIKSVSVETNPNHLSAELLNQLQVTGVNRLSVGVQSFDDGLLQAMQRLGPYGSGEAITRRLKRVNDMFATVNIDMMFNLPRQTEEMLRRDLDVLIDELGAAQVSFYPLMSNDGNRAAMSRTMGLDDVSNERRRYELIVERMLGAGYRRASAWCFSRKPGLFDEYIVNREQYLGLGSGAFSYLDGSLFASSVSLGEYARLVGSGRTGTVGQRDLSQREQMRYHLLMRLFSGSLDKRMAERRFSGGFERKLWPELMALKSIGAIRNSGDVIKLTESGYYRWLVMMRVFFTGISNLRDQMQHHAVATGPAVRTGV